MRESSIEKYLVNQAKAAGGWAVKLISPNASGMPDRLVLFSEGRIVFAEVKRSGGKPRALQAAVHKKLKALGFSVEVIDSKAKVDALIARYRGDAQ